MFKTLLHDSRMMLVHLDIRGSKRTEKTLEVEEGTEVLSLLRMLSIRPDSVICFAGDLPIPLDAALTEGIELTVLEAASGGDE